ncbi:hypothetical protein [Paenibacillus spongiae]|uniref:Uncharacterized protein n=1 Tax=Paenibacillus spongiae TaxID=2909671 RepID=A0ABY5SJC5_9BACL|nr:hypothetical protein [Paenibacillus spongiae]UVI32703.1 hypothetical protein L1F29_13130 [Paenibacillus spongiae]
MYLPIKQWALGSFDSNAALHLKKSADTADFFFLQIRKYTFYAEAVLNLY